MVYGHNLPYRNDGLGVSEAKTPPEENAQANQATTRELIDLSHELGPHEEQRSRDKCLDTDNVGLANRPHLPDPRSVGQPRAREEATILMNALGISEEQPWRTDSSNASLQTPPSVHSDGCATLPIACIVVYSLQLGVSHILLCDFASLTVSQQPSWVSPKDCAFHLTQCHGPSARTRTRLLALAEMPIRHGEGNVVSRLPLQTVMMVPSANSSQLLLAQPKGDAVLQYGGTWQCGGRTCVFDLRALPATNPFDSSAFSSAKFGQGARSP